MDNHNSHYNSPGKRFSHILDQIGFPEGRGRAKALHEYLKQSEPTLFNNLQYNTLHTWLHDFAPRMIKMDVIIALLQKDYAFPTGSDPNLIKAWWKLGGFYPFTQQDNKLENAIDKAIEKNLKTLSHLSESETSELKKFALTFGQHFIDPKIVECPDEYLEMFVKVKMQSLRKK